MLTITDKVLPVWISTIELTRTSLAYITKFQKSDDNLHNNLRKRWCLRASRSSSHYRWHKWMAHGINRSYITISIPHQSRYTTVMPAWEHRYKIELFGLSKDKVKSTIPITHKNITQLRSPLSLFLHGTHHTCEFFLFNIRWALQAKATVYFNMVEKCSIGVCKGSWNRLLTLVHTLIHASRLTMMCSHEVSSVLSWPWGGAGCLGWDH